jgi:perosamine synthetase
MVLCDSEACAERCRRLRNLCFDPARRFWHEELGWNYRMTAMQAALGLPQLRRVDELVARRRAQGIAYHRALRDVSELQLAPARTAHAENVFWVFGFVIRPDAPFSREAMMQALAKEGIGTRPFFVGLHQQPALLEKGLIDPVSLPVTERLAQSGMYLPGGPGLSEADQQRVIDVVRDFVLRCRR